MTLRSPGPRPEMSDRLQTPSLELAFAAQARNREFVRVTPVVPLHGEQAEVLCSVKLEHLQDTGSFKIRGATNAIWAAAPLCRSERDGAGAVPVAAALASGRRGPRTVCIVSGGKIDAAKLTAIMSGRVP
jgi:threonine dehydratase